MRILLMHYHLKTGGVTTVIKQQAAALSDAGHDVLLMCGEAPIETISAPVAVIAGLGYDPSEDAGALSAEALAAAVLKAVHLKWPGHGPDVIHVHNPTLAKNRRLQTVLKHLQQAGMTLLCQIHDFAEDGRPDVFFDESYAADCHYAVVNGRDLRLLRQAGLCKEGVHYLPNAVSPLTLPDIHDQGRQPSVLYPVRAIRRKNIGEAILLHLYSALPAILVITLPPNSDSDMPSYRAWCDLAARYQLPITFEAGLQKDFRQLMAQCRYTLTTSVTEGFGFVFLEAWTAGKALWGRLLPDICRDFISNGIRLDHLYTRLIVPLDWLDGAQLRRMWIDSLRAACRRYAYELSEEAFFSRWQQVSAQGLIDFGLVHESFQQTVIQRVIADKDAYKQLAMLNPFLSSLGQPAGMPELIAHNQKVVKTLFAPDRYGRRLLNLYQKVMACPVRQAIEKKVLLDQFLHPERFSLLKWSRYHG